MIWTLVVAAFVAGTIATFSDWLFMGILFHDRYNAFPEIWRPGIAAGQERGAIIWSSLIGYITAGAVVALCAMSGARDFTSALTIAGLAWMAGPLAVVLTNALFVKFDPLVTFAHALGYLVRFAIAGLAAALALSWT